MSGIYHEMRSFKAQGFKNERKGVFFLLFVIMDLPCVPGE